MKKFLLLLLWIFPMFTYGQIMIGGDGFSSGSVHKKAPYHGEKRRINDLVRTELKVTPHLDKHTLDGEADISLKPHFYPTDSLVLDAKQMEIHSVRVDGKDVKYTYDGQKLRIRLPRTYIRDQIYRVHIVYTAHPDDIKSARGTAITDNRGLYFIDATADYPAQFWTQGEPEANSAWFPTIDSPNQKSTEKISITVPAGWVTLSNGIRIDSLSHPDGTRTDVWEMNKPHAPYLFFMAGGPFVKVKDYYGNMPVNYYVEPKYAGVARKIFGHTPEMIKYFSRITGVDYPWPKFSQIVTRKFVSGAMENTTCVNHSDMAYQDADRLEDENRWETVIAHELFHHWFGDLVTAESWAQISMNESFADYSEALWLEHTEGSDGYLAKIDRDRRMYLMMPGASAKKLVRYHYQKPDDVFDVVSYQKGGAILHMLRHKLGDKAFFAGLNRYLTSNAYGTGEAERLRLALEDVSGMDLAPFFRQWFYGAGNPVLEIKYAYRDQADGSGKVTVTIVQKTDKAWKFPLHIDVYDPAGKARRYTVRVTDSLSEFTFPYRVRPPLVNVGADHALLARITDNRPDSTFYFQYLHGRNYIDRDLGLSRAEEHPDNPAAFRVITAALHDPYHKLRIRAIEALDVHSPLFNRRIERVLKDLALHDPKTLVRAAAVRKLAETGRKKYVRLFRSFIDSPSYALRTAAFGGILELDPAGALKIYHKLPAERQHKLSLPLARYYVRHRTPGKEAFAIGELLKDDGLLSLFMSNRAGLISDAIDWVTTGDSPEANRILIDNVLRLAARFDNTGIRNYARMMLRGYMAHQKKNQGPHHEEIMKLYRDALAKLKTR